MKRLWNRLYNNHIIYWRFRYVTRTRLRLQSWYRRRRPGVPTRQYRPRASASVVRYQTSRRSWLILALMVCALTALSVIGHRTDVNHLLIYVAQVGVILASLYAAVQGV
ncbi:MAG TPA: hypothetical protein VF898_03335 [Chloroflexota bacterium]